MSWLQEIRCEKHQRVSCLNCYADRLFAEFMQDQAKKIMKPSIFEAARKAKSVSIRIGPVVPAPKAYCPYDYWKADKTFI